LKTLSKQSLVRRHYLAEELLDPVHNITVNLIGVGGTGSVMLGLLARMHWSMLSIGHPTGISVHAYDPGEIREANVVRQLFQSSEIGQNKATALVGRLNRFYGLNWDGVPTAYKRFRKSHTPHTANITITCTDDVESRISVRDMLKGKKERIFNQPFYWLDIGNRRRDGQIILGTPKYIPQPKSRYQTEGHLPTILDLYPDYKYLASETDQGPSCSLMEALKQQDLFINGTLAHLAANLLWKLLTNYYIEEHALFVNLDTNIVKPKKV